MNGHPVTFALELIRHLKCALENQFVARANGAGRIYGTRRLSYPEVEFSLHMLTCHRDIDMAMWCLKSFSYHAEVSPHLMIHDDGSLTERDKEVLRSHHARCTVIDRTEADRRLMSVLYAHPHCREMRQSRAFHCALKLFDPPVYSPTDVLVLIDSDILFFRQPSELLECAHQGSPCYNSDYQDAYSASRERLMQLLDLAVPGKVNAGLLVMRRQDYDLDFMERYFACWQSPIPDPNRHEQTLHATLLARCRAKRLNDAYQISKQPITSRTVSHHFVNDGSRSHFFSKGVRTLNERGMVAKILL